ncbi:hypothetical protein [uncultured Sphingomonas sp.]|uniref:hypothetical protein n=1 Tax=uncultured Sphingomonas sp. TaxID=158754 RepID=UPI0035CA04BF
MRGQPASGLATLSSGLLARKGQARPAMRSQGYGGQGFDAFGAPAHPLEDLGWNDMGQADKPTDRDIVAQHLEGASELVIPAIPLPAVLVERAALAAEIAPDPAPPAAEPSVAGSLVAVKSISVPTAARLRRETTHAGKSAFTLRLDADRHLRMRLASAITNRSAQALLAQALDQLLSTLPEVETLAVQLPPAKGRIK